MSSYNICFILTLTMKKGLLIILLGLTIGCLAEPTLSPQATISLLTCTGGEELYSRYGHTAVEVRDSTNGIFVVFNYGSFSFTSNNFYWNFLRGNTYYKLSMQYAEDFYRNYAEENRSVFRQVFNFTDAQKQEVFRALVRNYRPENRQYLYNFVYDNCATRPYDLIRLCLQKDVKSTYTAPPCTYRQLLSYYAGPYCWGDFGINIIFGKEADVTIVKPIDRIFLPEELMNYLAKSSFADGQPFITEQSIGTFGMRKTPWYKTCWVGIGLFTLLISLLTFYDERRGRITWGVDAICFTLYGLLGCLIVMLVFFSIHPLVGQNWNLMLYNPLMFIPAGMCLFRRGQEWIMQNTTFLLAYLIIVLIVAVVIGQKQMVVSCLIPIIHIAIRTLCWKI